jgi:two-component system sensor histidine kinase CpxA
MKIRVTSIFAKIVLWFVATVILSLAGYVATSVLFTAQFPRREVFMGRMQTLLLDDARHAYEEGGPRRLADYLKRLNADSDAQHYLTDERGVDLATGEDRGDQLARFRRARGARRWPLLVRTGPPPVRIRSSDDRHYRLVSVLPQRVGPWDTLRYFVWLPLLIGLLCYILAVHLASPLRSLRKILERFGEGDLGIRLHLARHDEIGDLARAFNRMADQIATLMAAERRLLQDVSHELRSPLARLGFAVELARSSPDREAALSRIRREADRLNQLVDELLQLTRAEGDPAARIIEAVDLGRLLEELVADCALEAEVQDCRLELRLRHSAPSRGDRELLRRAFENVLRNAIRHAPAGSAIEVELTARGEGATISMRDHGPGVPPEALGEIFKPFYRVENDRDRSSGGTGLGLAIAQRAIELHQGKMTAANARPGLVVVIELPCQAAPLEKSVRAASAAATA